MSAEKEHPLTTITVEQYWNLLKNMHAPIVIMGTPGLCKTSLPAQVAETLTDRDGNRGKSCVIPVAQYSETGDMMGGIETKYLRDEKSEFLRDEHGEKIGKTVYLPPDIFPDHGMGFIIIDDFNRANSLITQSLLHLAQYREFGSYKIPEIEFDEKGNWVSGFNLVFTGNPDDGNHCVNELDNAFFTRAFTYELEFDKIMWGKWARKQDIDEKFISFLLKNSQYVNAKDNPRAFSNGFIQLKNCNDLDWIQFVMSGTGIDSYPALMSWLRKEWTELDFDSNDVFVEKQHKHLMKIFNETDKDGKTLFAERIATLNVQDISKKKQEGLKKFFHLMKKADEERFMIAFIPVNKECPDLTDDHLFGSLV